MEHHWEIFYFATPRNPAVHSLRLILTAGFEAKPSVLENL
jgi:hypothetical protein